MTDHEYLEGLKAHFNIMRGRMELLFSKVPDDKINWSPAPTARTPVELVAHSGSAAEAFTRMFEGMPGDLGDLQVLDEHLRKSESAYKTREAALDELAKGGAAYFAALNEGLASRRETIIQGPFGPMPFDTLLRLPSLHIMGHTAQLEYLQSIYGDRNWYR